MVQQRKLLEIGLFVVMLFKIALLQSAIRHLYAAHRPFTLECTAIRDLEALARSLGV